MKKIVPGLMLVMLLMASQSAAAQISLKEGRLHYKDGSATKSLVLEDGAIQKVRHSDLVFVLVTDPDLLLAAQKEEGLFFFDHNGALVGSYAGRDGFDPEMCAGASMSPGSRVLALDNGAWLVRVWLFLNYPDFTEISPVEDPFVSYLSDEANESSDLTWVDDNTVVITDISEAPVSRPCPADPCEPLDVVVHFIDNWQSVALAKGSELCNYRFKSLKGRSVTVDKICTKSIEDWGDPARFKSVSTVTQEIVQVPPKP